MLDATTHPVFAKFHTDTRTVPSGFVQDSFLGTIRRQDILESPSDDRTVAEGDAATFPHFDEEYHEWIDLLESIVAADGSYTFAELGAGFGRWSVRAAFAAEQLGGLKTTLVAAEPEHTHFLWLNEHLRANQIDPASHVLVEAAVNDVDGVVSFTVDSGREEHADLRPSRWYGQAIWRDQPVKQCARKILGAIRPSVRLNWSLAEVKAISLASLLQRCGTVDLADMDVQGAELTILSRHIDRATSQIKRLHIGTHSRAIEKGLRHLLSTNGWECLVDLPCNATNTTPFGTTFFGDGVQSWINTNLS